MNHRLELITTEQPNERTREIDLQPTEQIVRLINEEDRLVADKINEIIPQISAAVDIIADSLSNGGRLFYIGAGTSGRLGILDASECPPTYGTAPDRVQGIMAGGSKAVSDAMESAEDSEELGAQDIELHRVCDKDVVVGIAASGRTPYVIGAMRKAGQIGAKVIGLVNNHDTPMAEHAMLMLEAVVGPEAVTGSTRMKAGTAQKMILNMLTTAAMIRIGKVYGNLMVDLKPSNDKLVYRAKRIIRMATSAPQDVIERAFIEAQGHVKTAIVMILADADVQEAQRLLQEANGFVRQAIELSTR